MGRLFLESFIVEEVGGEESDSRTSYVRLGYRWSYKPSDDFPAPTPVQPVSLASGSFREKGAQLALQSVMYSILSRLELLVP